MIASAILGGVFTIFGGLTIYGFLQQNFLTTLAFERMAEHQIISAIHSGQALLWARGVLAAGALAGATSMRLIFEFAMQDVMKWEDNSRKSRFYAAIGASLMVGIIAFCNFPAVSPMWLQLQHVAAAGAMFGGFFLFALPLAVLGMRRIYNDAKANL